MRRINLRCFIVGDVAGCTTGPVWNTRHDLPSSFVRSGAASMCPEELGSYRMAIFLRRADIRNRILATACDWFPFVSWVAVGKFGDRTTVVFQSVVSRKRRSDDCTAGVLYNGGKAYPSFDRRFVVNYRSCDSIFNRDACLSRTI